MVSFSGMASFSLRELGTMSLFVTKVQGPCQFIGEQD